MRKLLRTTATAATALSIAAGGIAGASSVTTQGPNSPIDASSNNHQTWSNDNKVDVKNNNDQTATTGSAKVRHNTTGGDATSGDASNSNSASTSVQIENGGSMGAGAAALSGGSDTLSTAGPDSEINATWSNNTSVTNKNQVYVTNTSVQQASSGNARVSGNTTGGDATSGDASNTNSSTTEISVSN